jgi:two-component system, NtrC family, sensor histidine kinase HydH
MYGPGLMETFVLAAVGLIIAVSLIINNRRDPLHLSFAALCLAIFFYKGGAFFSGVFVGDFWKITEYLGLVAIPPVVTQFTRALLNQRTLISPRDMVSVLVFSCMMAVALFTPLYQWPYLKICLYLYNGSIIVICYASLLMYMKNRRPGVEKRRMYYLSVACGVTAALSCLDIISFYGYSFPPFSNLFIAVLLYFVLIFITHPQLPELYELLAKGLVVSIITLFAAFTMILVTGLFGKGALPFTHAIVASFIIVITTEPFIFALKRIFGYIYPYSKEIFSSLYTLDEKLEKEKSILLEEMAPVLAHEIRNPLGSIKGAAQYLRSEADTDENQRLLDVIIEEVDRLNGVVSQFLNYAKPYMLNLKVQDVNQVIEKAISIIRASRLSNHVAIEKELRSDLPPVPIDAEQLVQVILNISFNAIEAMPAGGSLIFRTSKIERDTGAAVGISIRDTGEGIKKEDMKNIFKPFYTTKERGVGLGLAICRRIIKNHGGFIGVKSIPGRGSIFYIRLGIPN